VVGIVRLHETLIFTEALSVAHARKTPHLYQSPTISPLFAFWVRGEKNPKFNQPTNQSLNQSLNKQKIIKKKLQKIGGLCLSSKEKEKQTPNTMKKFRKFKLFLGCFCLFQIFFFFLWGKN